jgi:hypothetical protein
LTWRDAPFLLLAAAYYGAAKLFISLGWLTEAQAFSQARHPA